MPSSIINFTEYSLYRQNSLFRKMYEQFFVHHPVQYIRHQNFLQQFEFGFTNFSGELP